MHSVKRMQWIWITALAILMPAASAFSADVAKIGVIDSQRILMESDAGKEVQAKINAAGKEMEAKLKELGGQIEELKKKGPE